MAAAAAPAAADRPLAEPARRFLDHHGAQSTLVVSRGASLLPTASARVDLGRAPQDWPAQRVDAVVIGDAFEHMPPADIPWVLDEAFARAIRVVVIELTATAAGGVGSSAWWRLRVEEAASRRPDISWHLECRAGLPGAGASFSVDRLADAGTPRVWALLDGDPEHQAQVLSLARALGWPFETRPLAFNAAASLPPVLLGASLRSIDRAGTPELQAPWPDLVIASGARSVPVARWLRQQNGGRTRLVHLGRPGAPFTLFDLIVTTPESRLPIRPNVLHVAAPLLDEGSHGSIPPGTAPAEPAATLLLAGGDLAPFAMSATVAAELGRAAAAKASQRGGALLMVLGPRVSASAAESLRQAVGPRAQELDRAVWTDYERRRAHLAAADEIIVTPGDAQLLAEACLTGRPVSLFELPKWHDRFAGVRPVMRVLSLLSGGGVTYRGTPHQQHVLSRFLDEMTTKGLFARPTDLGLLHRSLIARGLVTAIGQPEGVASPKPLDDLRVAAERVRRLMSEAPRPISASNG
jgi:mitochondrial fission protein ELM1